MIRIDLDPQGDTISLRLTEYLGSDLFPKYRDACASVGARFVPTEKLNRAPVEAFAAIVAAFEQAGLPFASDPALIGKLQEAASEAEQLLKAGQDRLKAAQEILAGQGEKLFRFQETGVEWMAPRSRALLGDEMGLGKTVQALMALPENAAALVIVPSAVRFNWKAEVARWRPDLSPAVIPSKATFRWPIAGEILIATYGIVPAPEAIAAPPPVGCFLLADEAHYLKNHKAKRTQNFYGLRDQVLAYQGKTWGITGTPLLNRPPELWAVLQAFGLAEEAFGNWYNFVRLFNGRRASQYGGFDWGIPLDEAADCIRRVALIRKRAEVLRDLPGKIRRTIPVNGLDRATKRICDEVVAIFEENGIDLDKIDKDVEMSKLGGVAFEKMSAARAALATAKIPAMLDLVSEYEEQEQPLVVFSAHKAPVLALGEREGWEIITGSTPSEKRTEIIARFQGGELKGIAGTIGAMGVGVTLTRAHELLMVDLAWTPALNSQAEDRVCRIGQDRGVIVTRLVAQHKLDERVLELLTIKQEIIEASVDAAAVEEDYLGESPAEQLAKAAARAIETVGDSQRVAQERKEQIEKERKAEQKEQIASLKKRADYDGREIEVAGKLRSPLNAQEAFASQALLKLAELDPDRAGLKNEVGFSATDGEFGHSLAEQFSRKGMFSDKQWPWAIKFAIKYRRQVGEMPVLKTSKKRVRL